jgi:hypothetical protein
MICRILVRASVVAIALSIVLPVAVRAQSAITGVVKDTSGAVLPGVKPKLRRLGYLRFKNLERHRERLFLGRHAAILAL